MMMDSLLELQEEDREGGVENETRIRVPSYEVARRFAGESVEYPVAPLGLYRPRRLGRHGEVSLDLYCPEYRLCSKDT